MVRGQLESESAPGWIQAPERVGHLRHARQCRRVLSGLVRRELLCAEPTRRSNRTNKRNAESFARRILFRSGANLAGNRYVETACVSSESGCARKRSFGGLRLSHRRSREVVSA